MPCEEKKKRSAVPCLFLKVGRAACPRRKLAPRRNQFMVNSSAPSRRTLQNRHRYDIFSRAGA